MPKEYSLTTSLPQAERIEGAERIVEASSVQPTFALTLAYDREWQVLSEKARRRSTRTVCDSGVSPDRAAIVQEFRQVHSLLAGRFGEPEERLCCRGSAPRRSR